LEEGRLLDAVVVADGILRACGRVLPFSSAALAPNGLGGSSGGLLRGLRWPLGGLLWRLRLRLWLRLGLGLRLLGYLRWSSAPSSSAPPSSSSPATSSPAAATAATLGGCCPSPGDEEIRKSVIWSDHLVNEMSN